MNIEHIKNNRSFVVNFLIIIVIIMSILGTVSFVLFFTNCPTNCIPKKETYNDIFNNKQHKQHKQHKHHKHHLSGKSKNYTQLIPLEDILDSF
tara:strand:+ start:85 stop:363 length:279 start_codon:yes stop_codon:yes gene_type:complete